MQDLYNKFHFLSQKGKQYWSGEFYIDWRRDFKMLSINYIKHKSRVINKLIHY